MLSLAVETWQSAGVWVTSRHEMDYPERLHRLKQNAPPLLYGCGEKKLLSRGGLAIVGSRDVDAAGEEFTKRAAASAAREEIQVVSGGARGVDQLAMLAALEAGGTVFCGPPRLAGRENQFKMDASHWFLLSIPKLASTSATRCNATNRFMRWEISALLSVPASMKVEPGQAQSSNWRNSISCRCSCAMEKMFPRAIVNCCAGEQRHFRPDRYPANCATLWKPRQKSFLR